MIWPFKKETHSEKLRRIATDQSVRHNESVRSRVIAEAQEIADRELAEFYLREYGSHVEEETRQRLAKIGLRSEKVSGTAVKKPKATK